MKPLHVHIALSMLNHIAFNGCRIGITLYAAWLGESPVMIGALGASFGVVSAFTAVHVGRWIDRVGPRRPMMIASLCVAAAAAVAALSRSVWPLFLACPVMGMFNSTFQIATSQTIGRYGEPSDRPKNFALQSLGISIANFTGPMVAGLAIDYLSYAWAFGLLAVAGAAPLMVIGSNGLHFPERAQRKREGGATPGGWRLLREEKLRRVYIVACLNNAVWSVVTFMIPLYGVQVGISATLIGTLMGSLSAGAIAIRASMGMMIRKWKPWPLVLFAQSAIAVGFLAMPFFSWLWVLAPLAFLVGIGLGLAGPVSTSLMYDASPADKVAEVIGMRTTAANVAQTIVPLIAGGVGSAFGVGPAFWVVAAVVLGDVWSNRVHFQAMKADAPRRRS